MSGVGYSLSVNKGCSLLYPALTISCTYQSTVHNGKRNWGTKSVSSRVELCYALEIYYFIHISVICSIDKFEMPFKIQWKLNVQIYITIFNIKNYSDNTFIRYTWSCFLKLDLRSDFFFLQSEVASQTELSCFVWCHLSFWILLSENWASHSGIGKLWFMNKNTVESLMSSRSYLFNNECKTILPMYHLACLLLAFLVFSVYSIFSLPFYQSVHTKRPSAFSWWPWNCIDVVAHAETLGWHPAVNNVLIRFGLWLLP